MNGRYEVQCQHIVIDGRNNNRQRLRVDYALRQQVDDMPGSRNKYLLFSGFVVWLNFQTVHFANNNNEAAWHHISICHVKSVVDS